MDTVTTALATGAPAPAAPADSAERPLELLVKGARCANCVARIERGVGEIPGVRSARLNLTTGKLTVAAPSRVGLAVVKETLRGLGYDAWPYDPAAMRDADDEEGRFLLTCLVIAGFGMAFVGGLTDALYYGATDMRGATHALFSWLEALVSAPTALLSGRPFFRSALASLRVGRANMDVPISLAIVFSLGLSFYEAFQHGSRTYFDAAVTLPFLLLVGRYLDFVVRRRAWNAANALVAMQAVDSRRISPVGDVETVPASALRAGDRILLSSGERAPVDGVVLHGDTQADLSLVTGETVPVVLTSGSLLRAGSVVLGPAVTLDVRAGVQDSLLADITRLIEAGQQNRNRYVRLADRAARLYVPLVHGFAFAVFVAWLIPLHAGFAVALRNAVSLLIITCPCALGLAVPAVQVVASGLLFRRGLLVKSGDALERLAGIDVAVFDKTGTLTLGRPALLPDAATPPALVERAARLARSSRHPLAAALARAAGAGPSAPGSVEVAGKGIEVCADGVLLRLGQAAWVGAISRADETSELWYREGNDAPVRFAFSDELRPDAVSALRDLEAQGIAIELLSGDRAPVVETAARLAGIATWRAGVDPIAKTKRLKELRDQGRKVLMVGDGLNDAAALALAHVSISPASAIDAAQAAADLVLHNASLSAIPEALRVSRKARALVLENFGFAAAYNAVAVPLAAAGLVTPLIAAVSMAASSLIVTLNALRQSVKARN